MGEDISLNNYMKCAEHYLVCGESYAGHLANICKSNPDEIITAKTWILFVKIYPCIKPLQATKAENCLNALDLLFMTPKQT